MDEEDDDFYAPEEHTSLPSTSVAAPDKTLNEQRAEDRQSKEIDQKITDDIREDEDEDAEESDSDIDIITERKDGSKPEPSPQSSRHNVLRNVPAGKPSSDAHQETPAPSRKDFSVKTATPARSGADYPAIRTSKIDVDHVPIYKSTGKTITELDIDEDLKEHDKPWRIPGSDVSDYFNYGFDEFTWTLYCLKHDETRAQVQEDKKEFTNGMMMGPDGAPLGLPSIPALPSNTTQMAANLSTMPAMGDFPPEVQAMMTRMFAQGMDPSQQAQMDPAAFGMQQAGAGQVPGTGTAQGQVFNNQPGYPTQGQPQQQMNFGYDPPMMGVEGGRNRQGNFGGRGRGNRRNW